MKVVVAIEDSAPTLAALRFAARLAAASRGEMIVVAPEGAVPHGLAGTAGLDRGLASALNEAARLFSANALALSRIEARRFGARIRSESTRPRRSETIAETTARVAERERADLVVVGKHGGMSPVRWILGSFVSQLVHVVPRPVAVVPDHYAVPERRISRIVAATDGSAASLEAVRFGARLAAGIPRARLVILAVSTLAADVGLTGPRLVKALGLLPALREADRRAARKILDEAAREARRLGASVTVRYRAPRRRVFAERAVLSEAARERADLIVLGNSGRGAMGDVLLGSVAQRVVSLARRPVVLVRARARRASARKRP